MLASNDRTSFKPILLDTSTTGRNEFTERANRVRRPKPHQPRFEIENCNITNQQEDNPLLPFSAKVNTSMSETTSMSTFLLACGASRDFISHTEVMNKSLPMELLPHKLRVILADDRTTVATHQCYVMFTVNFATSTRACVVINMNSAYDIILGMPLLRDVNPTID